MVKKPNRRISSHHFLNQTKTFPISDAPECRTHDEPKEARHRADHHDHDPILSPRGVYTVDGIRLGDVENRLGRKRADIYSGTNWGSAIRIPPIGSSACRTHQRRTPSKAARS